MTARKQLEEEIRQASLVDELTELHNRRGFMLLGDQQLSAAARYGRPLLLLFADLDGLKSINDELGHQQGDLALTDTAEVLRATFRRSDIIARLGGDEFVVLAEGDEQFGGIMQRRIEERLHVHNATAWRAYELSLSIGMAVFKPGTGTTLSELLALADKQMYQRKRETRNAQQLPRRYSGFEATLRHSDGSQALGDTGAMWAPERRTRKP